MATLTYNGVSLPYVNVLSFEQKVLEDDSRTDWYCTLFDITVTSVLNPSYIQIRTPGGVLLTSPADIMATLRTLLLARRKPLSLTHNGVELLPKIQFDNAGTVDAQNGPKPVMCKLTQLTNATFLLQYQITAVFWENNTVAPASTRVNNVGNVVLYNRWQETVDIDDMNFSTRTRRGKLAIRSDNAPAWIADRVRSAMAVVGVPPGFLRSKASYTVDPSGLILQYEVADREVYKMPPLPAFKAEGEFTMSYPDYGGPRRFGAVRVKLYGDASVNSQQRYLIDRAIAVAMFKLLINSDDPTSWGSFFTTTINVRVGMYENWVEAQIAAAYQPGKKRAKMTDAVTNATIKTINQCGFIAGLFGIPFIPISTGGGGGGSTTPGVGKPFAGIGPGMTFTPITDNTRGYTPPYHDRGTAGILLQAAAYFDPSLTIGKNQLTASALSTAEALAGGGTNNPLTTVGTNAKTQMIVGAQPGQAGEFAESHFGV